VAAHPKCSRRNLFEALAPAALATTQAPVENAPAPELSPEASAVISDLHWLVHQGHVIEFANGTLETAKKPQPKPQPKPEKVKSAAPTEATPAVEPTGEQGIESPVIAEAAALSESSAPASSDETVETAQAPASGKATPTTPELNAP
jgi:hypothetical protein